MPKASVKKKPVQPVAPTAPEPLPSVLPTPVPAPDGREVKYPDLVIEERSTTSEKGPLDAERCRGVLQWETESQFLARKAREHPDSRPEQWMKNAKKDKKTGKSDVFGDDYHCKNIDGEKVRCAGNANNREFDGVWCRALTMTILSGQWAGPHTIPGATVNGETVRISKYGQILSGQHSLTACVLADEILQKARAEFGLDEANRKYPAWSTHNHCFIETIVVKGMSDDPAVLMTVDYVKPRSVADMFYTRDVFRDATAQQRQDLCRMLAVACDTTWTRTQAQGYKTHPEMVGFLERHKSLLKCVEHLFRENRPEAKEGRRISKLHLSPGHCSALEYLMASGKTADSHNGEGSDVYRNMDPAPSEKGIDFSLWDLAEEFWTLLGNGDDLEWVRVKLGQLTLSKPGDDNQGLGGRMEEKLAVLARAWAIFKEGGGFSEEDLADGGALSLAYSDFDENRNELPPGQVRLIDIPDFGGIDLPKETARAKGGAEPPPPTQEEIWGTTERAGRAEQLRREAVERRGGRA